MNIPQLLPKAKALITRHKRISCIVAAGLAICTIAILLYYHAYKPWRVRQAEAQAEKSAQVVRDSRINPVTSIATRLEIETYLRKKEYRTVKILVEEILAQQDATISDKYFGYTTLGTVCMELADFACMDKVIEFQKSTESLDYYTVVEVARLAKSQNQPEKAKQYYKLALDSIDAKGGHEYLTKATEGLEMPLDYNEIADGAKQ